MPRTCARTRSPTSTWIPACRAAISSAARRRRSRSSCATSRKAVEDPVSGKSFYDGWSARFDQQVAARRDDRRRDRLHRVPGIPRHLLHRHVFRRPVRRLSLDVRQLLPPEHGGRSGLQDRRRPVASLERARLAPREHEILPMRYSDYARAAVGYIEAAEQHAGTAKPLELKAARAAAARWESGGDRFRTAACAGRARRRRQRAR